MTDFVEAGNLKLKKDQIYEINIDGMNHEGQGVGRLEGFTFFVNNAIQDEKVKAKITLLKKSYAVADVVEILKPSKERKLPFCSIYEKCGGCHLQHMSYEETLRYKKMVVEDALKRIAKIEDIQVNNVLGMKKPTNYRNKVQYPVGKLHGKSVIGFYEKRSHVIVDSESCEIHHETGDKIKNEIKAFINSNNISVYDEKTSSGLIKNLIIRVGFKTNEIMVILVINDDNLKQKKEFVETLTAKFPEIKTIVLNINKEKSNVILGKKNKVIYGVGIISDFIADYKFMISPNSFFQVNPIQTEILYGKALEFAQLTGGETVFDLYSGIGTISLFLSKKAGKVYGVENVKEAVENARDNAKLNRVENVEFIEGTVENIIPQMYNEGKKAHIVVVDPPRSGCDEALLETMVKMKSKRIVYVSCNPSTLARDLKYLCENGYAVKEVQPVDMFPWTSHVEVVVGLKRKHSD